ncbi:EamA family transporter [Nitrogeniibacter mangrovi]|uniref:EamA family transporter n=1 Tax=Nitrogeniibacter mangrovi TaxID=2016596 RepID=A0A6C1B8J8_9RHOO|nr:EamA family transporter [Nitrogeniibacter mangrovi]QID19279.1 EamA family transporter [Nitrogeniibacter mangrovi]
MRPSDILLALVVVLVWGMNFVVIKAGVSEVPPLLLGALRFTAAALPAVFFVRAPRLPLSLYLKYGMTIAVGQFACLFTAIHVGMPSGLASLVLQSQAFFTLIFAVVFLKEAWRPSQLVGLLLAAIGLALIGTTHGVSMPLGGFLLTVAGAASWAVGNIVNRSLARHGPVSMVGFVVWSSLVPPLPFLALSLLIEGPEAITAALSHFSLRSLGAVAYLAWGATLLGYGLWSRLMSRYPASQVSPFPLLVPLVGLTAGWLIYDEALRPVHLLGGALLMLGLVVNLFWPRLSRRWRERGLDAGRP